MSSNIWTRCAGTSELRALGGHAWRAVEAQHLVSTSKLVDSLAEQAVLEDLIERQKPSFRPPEEFAGFHFLLATPFRYAPLRRGSRFATRSERSLWYGARAQRTALAEVAFHRLLFLDGTAARIERLAVDLTVFRVPIRTRLGIDLRNGPFREFESRISSPTDYADTQPLGTAMRAAGVEAFCYRSARDRLRGSNVALFTPRAFAAPRPGVAEVWHCVATRAHVDFLRKDALERATFTFPRSDFEVADALPFPS